MVIDWNKQIDECIKNTKIMPIFHGNSISYCLEHALIVKKLINNGYTDEQILNWMILAGSNLIYDMSDLQSFKRKAERKRWPKKHEFKIFITMDEIKYIDDIKTTKEKKAYLLGLISFAKMMKIKHKKPTFKPRYKGFVYYIATGIDGYSKGKQCYKDINKFIYKLCKKQIIRFKDNTTRFIVYTETGPIKDEIRDSLFIADWVNWDASSGYCITNLETDVKMLADHAFHDQIKICNNCGKEFIITSYTKTDLCPECQKKMQYNRTKQWQQSHPECSHNKKTTHGHGKRKKPSREVVCEKCGKIFIASSKCKRTLCEDCYEAKRKKSRRK